MKKEKLLYGFSLVPLYFGLHSCSENVKNENVYATNKVRVIQIGSNTDEFRSEYIGTVESSNTVDVSFLTTGTIEKMNFSEGQKVSKGQLMATLNTTTLKSAHNTTLASMKQAKDAYNRMNEMYKSQSLPEIKLIDVRTKLEQAQSAEIMARKSLNDSYLYAPESGVISKKNYETGMNAVMGSPVYTIMNINSVDINVPIPESEISHFSRGQKCDIKVTALGNKGFSGQIIEKGVSANPISHTYNIKVRIANFDDALMPGMVVKAYFDSTAANTAATKVIIPLKYVLLDYPDKRFVWIADKENKAQRKMVTLGTLLGNNVEIINGLKQGDKIITDGYQNISVGSKVTFVNQ